MGIHRAHLMVVAFLHEAPAAAGFISRFTVRPKLHKCQKEDMLHSSGGFINYWLEVYAREDIIAITKDDMIVFTKSPNKLTTEYPGPLWNKVSPRNIICDEYVRKGIGIEGLPESLLLSAVYTVPNKNSTVQNFAIHSTSITKLKIGSQKTVGTDDMKRRKPDV